MSTLTRRQVFDILCEKSGEGRSDQTKHLIMYLISYFNIEDDEVQIKRLKKVCYRLCSAIFAKLEQCSRIHEKFLSNNKQWLSTLVDFKIREEEFEERQLQHSRDETPSTSSGISGGRPRKQFSEIGERAKRKRVEKLTEKYEAEELSFAAKKSLKEKGETDAAHVISEAIFTTPTRASKMKTSWKAAKDAKNVVPLTDDEALSLIMEAKLSKHQYLLIRREAKSRNADIYPAYNKVLDAKSRCYPPKEATVISEQSAEIKLQELLDHTVQRIVKLQESVLETLEDEVIHDLTLLLKWGCDGSTGHSQYKQKFAQIGLGDGDLFLSCLVPLQVYWQDVGTEKNKLIVWQNPRPSSTRFCRPIKFHLKKETTHLALSEQTYIANQIANLSPTICKIGERTVSVKHLCIMSMIDGKICNALTETSSSQKCYICNATPKQMNDIDEALKKEVRQETFKFGLSTLHAWIRFFECLLHISYRLDIQKWQVRGKEHKATFEARKKKIQEDFKNKMGLLVDFPKIGGSGTTNDGNTARRFFQNIEQSASITGIDEVIIRRFAVILSTLSSGYEINIKAFQEYSEQTARLFTEKYKWFYMPASVHKILIHGSAVIQAALLPIGQLSEEAQESRNKDLKKYRELHTRKFSRVATNEDLLNRLLISSDPLISSLRKLPKKN